MATKLSTNWEFWIQEVEELCYPCSESKGADQPRGYREADPRPCPRVQNVAPLTRRLIYNNLTERPDRPLCCGCNTVIDDRWMLNAGTQPFHLSCLRCSVCLLTLDTHSSCYVRDGQVYCKYHYKRVFGTRCAACGDDLEPTDWVRHVGDSIYHISCFTCSVCGVEMATGDECMIRDSALLCRAHGMLGLRNDDVHDTRENEKASADRDDSGKPRKRPRSSFTREQLTLLHSHFDKDPTPSVEDTHHLASMTGHTYRVIQIWFQNARARSKKRRSCNSDANSDGMASSPWSSDLNSPESQHSLID